MFKKLFHPNEEKRATVTEVLKYLDDKWLTRSVKKYELEDGQSLCYSSYSIHSSKLEKDMILHALKAHGIETTVDRAAKKRRINEWIERSLMNQEQNKKDLEQYDTELKWIFFTI